MKYFFLSSLVTAFVLCGCASTGEICRESDLSIEEIEKRKTLAVDPDGRYAKAKTSVMRQEIRTAVGWMEPEKLEMVEIKYEEPGNFKLTTFEDNEPVSAIIINNDQAWLANYDNESVFNYPLEELKKVRLLQKLSMPDTKLKDVFAEIKAYRCTVDEKEYYKLVCSNPGMRDLNLYIDANDFLPRRITGTFSINGTDLKYESEMVRYALFEGVRIADESIVKLNNLKQTGKVIFFKLDIPLHASDFRPPVF